MITAWELYWLTRLDAMNIAAIIVAAICLVGLIVGSIIYVTTDEQALWKSERATAKLALRVSIPCGILALMALIFIPTTQEMAAITVIPMLANETVEKDAGKLYKLSVEWMKSQLSEGTHNHGEK